MTDLNNSAHILYRQALVDPSRLTEDDLLGLIVRFPYSQPLIFAYERRKKLVEEESPSRELALLYAANANWLWSFVNAPMVKVEEIVPEEEEYIPFEIYDGAGEIRVEDEAGTTEEVLEEEVDVEAAAITETEVEADAVSEQEGVELDKLVHGGAVLGDYFVFEQKEKGESPENSDVMPILSDDEPEDVSLYNDDLMPYSFRWWLHKTRLEYADTYQPFIVPHLPKPEKGHFDLSKLDETILDQQIKENIIHFQAPESKLSDAVKNSPLKVVEPKKSDEVIERFIKEEPIIQAPSAQKLHNENMARQSAEDNYSLVTETLANIYVDQALYLKAIEVFKKLILKYPEKKSYFATQIQELEKNL
ncbi:hypothetical protein [Sphingobacterium paucimobilis]|uniref:Tetratricopeptide repeat protein n=1 Tax=Sphingobacterium paucimobilis HER1398 TaxID=1346330 RepID=U2J0D4_9SPHI|nr:hypothetical protein [Sphingobacterium paucimobilis]ERJ58424.1 hypothetical protein M472_06560 [Sphingobacterium paucimobilis HER1398]